MKKFFVLALAFVLAACGNGSSKNDDSKANVNNGEKDPVIADLEKIVGKDSKDDAKAVREARENIKTTKAIEKEEKDYTDISDEEKADIYEELDGQFLTTSFYPSTTHSQINFEADGKFTGNYVSSYAFDGIDYGHQAISVEKYATDELHSSEFVGEFEVLGKINDGIYKIKLKNFKLTTKPGFDPEYEHTYYVDFAEALDEKDSYFLFLPGTKLPDYILDNEELGQYFTPVLSKHPVEYITNRYLEEGYEPDHTIGIVIFDKTCNKTFTDYHLE